MKKIFAIVISVMIIFCSTVGVYADNTPDENAVGKAAITSQQSRNIKANYNLDSSYDKLAFAKEIFAELGVNEKYAELLNDNWINAFVESEEFGVLSVVPTERTDFVMPLAGGSDIREYDDMALTLIWGKSGTVYTVSGVYVWKKMPVMRSKDILSLDISGNGGIKAGTQSAVMQYNKSGQTYEEWFTRNNAEYTGVGTACVFKINLPNICTDLCFVLGYSIDAVDSKNTICIQYFHNFLPAVLSVSLSYFVGISVGPSNTVTEYNLHISDC